MATYSTGPYSLNLLTRVVLGLGPPDAHSVSHEDPAPNWEEEVCEQFLTFAQSPSILSDVINTFDRQPVGWFPPLYPSHYPQANQNLPPTPTPAIPDLPKLDNSDYGYPNTRRDGVGSTSSVPASPAFAHSPSPSAPIRGPIVGSARRAEDESDSPALSPLPTLREKERRRIRQDSGVKPKAKTPQARRHRSIRAAPNSRPPLEMVQCQWADCTKRLHVDYVSVRHWGKHVREHYAKEQDMIQCEWEGGCGAVINKSSMWKHIIVHEPKFKIRCPHGCDVSTRGDMMRRHLRSCPHASDRVAKEVESDGEGDSEVEEGNRGSDCEDNEEGRKED